MKFDIKIFFICAGIFLFMGLVSALFPFQDISQYYDFEETSGDLLDLVGFSDGVIGADPGYGIQRGSAYPGIIGNGYNFTANSVGNGGAWINISNPTDACDDLECSISLWINWTGTNARTIYHLGNATRYPSIEITSNAGAINGGPLNSSSSFQTGTGNNANNNGLWQHIVLVLNVTDSIIYNNGTLMAHNPLTDPDDYLLQWSGIADKTEFIGCRPNPSIAYDMQDCIPMMFDELGIWDKQLTQSEITDLWNNGAGEPFIFGPVITYNSPEDNSITSIQEQTTFNATLTTQVPFNVKNATLWIYNSTELVENDDILTLSGIEDEAVWYRNITTLGTYTWNIFGCVDDGISTACIFGSNRTLNTNAYTVDANFYEADVYETENQFFEINISTIDTILNVDADLIYNDTITKQVFPSCNSTGFCNIKTNIDIPLVDGAEVQNKSFIWNITVFDGTTSYTSSTSELYQNTTRVHLDVCGTYTDIALNFSAYNEQNLSRINPFQFAGDFHYWLGSGSVKQNTSVADASITEKNLCIYPTDRTLHTNAIIDYSFDNENITFVPRNYYLQNNSVTSTQQDIPLFLLDSESATTFILKVQDSTQTAIPEALISIQRYYPGEDLFRTVQIAKTDDNGESVGFYETETVDYKHIISLNNSVLLSTNAGKIVGKSVPFTLIFTVGETASVPWTPFQNNTNIVTSLTYNETTEFVTFSYIDTSGGSPYGRLLVQQLSRSNSSSSTVCDVTSSFSSATLLCNMSGQDGSFIAKGYVGSSTDLSDLINFIMSTAKDVFDKTGLFLGVFIILTASMAFIFNPTVGIIAINGAIIFVNIIGLATFSPIFIFSIIGVSILILILMKT